MTDGARPQHDLASDFDSDLQAEMQRLAGEAASEHRCPSLSWGITRGRRLVAAGGVGTVGGVAPTVYTSYRIASMTKSFSAAATLLLRDEGVISLDAPIATYAPELTGVRHPSEDAPAITVRDLLCMTSGLVSDDPWADRHLDLSDDDFDAIVARPLVFAQPTGIEFEYSNFGYALLGRVVLRATGVRLQEYVSQRLLQPLGMVATSWVQPSHDDWARPYRWDQDDADAATITDGDDAGRRDGVWNPEPTPGDGGLAPMGGVWTTVSDLAAWVGWLADAFPARDDADDGPLLRSSRREMQTMQRWVGMRTIRNVEAPSGYGYGLRICEEARHGRVVTHSGGLPGYGSNMRWTARSATTPSVGAVALANVTYAPMGELAALMHDAAVDHYTESSGDSSLPVPAELDRTARRLVAVLDRWAAADTVDPSELDSIFADNVDPDEPYVRRAAAVARFGSLRVDTVRPLNGAHVDVECTTADGSRATVGFALAVHSPGLVQDYEVTTPDGVPDSG